MAFSFTSRVEQRKGKSKKARQREAGEGSREEGGAGQRRQGRAGQGAEQGTGHRAKGTGRAEPHAKRPKMFGGGAKMAAPPTHSRWAAYLGFRVWGLGVRVWGLRVRV